MSSRFTYPSRRITLRIPRISSWKGGVTGGGGGGHCVDYCEDHLLVASDLLGEELNLGLKCLFLLAFHDFLIDVLDGGFTFLPRNRLDYSILLLHHSEELFVHDLHLLQWMESGHHRELSADLCNKGVSSQEPRSC